MPIEHLPKLLVSTLVFTVAGVVAFAIALWVMTKLSPFSIRKEIEHDQNTALAILMSSVFLGLAIIIAAAIHG